LPPLLLMAQSLMTSSRYTCQRSMIGPYSTRPIARISQQGGPKTTSGSNFRCM